ncbi:hypothetical protein GCM10028774_66150 [Spirosoma jeollabukense]
MLLINLQIESYDKYNFDKIDQNGIEKKAKIVDLRPYYNVTINGENPLRIRYEYSMDGVTKLDRFQTFDLDKTNDMKIGSEILIKVLGNESKIKNLEPYVFPYNIFYLFPLLFFLIGLPFFLYGLIPALREYDLHKNGNIKEGTIISLIDNTSSLRPNAAYRILVGYFYLNSNGEKLFGESKVTDYVVMKDIKVDNKLKLFVSGIDETKSCILPNYEAKKNNWQI